MLKLILHQAMTINNYLLYRNFLYNKTEIGLVQSLLFYGGILNVPKYKEK